MPSSITASTGQPTALSRGQSPVKRGVIEHRRIAQTQNRSVTASPFFEIASEKLHDVTMHARVVQDKNFFHARKLT